MGRWADTGIFDEGRYFDVFVTYAKQGPDHLLMRITVANRGPDAAPLQLLPSLWFRNTWSWGDTLDEVKSRPGRCTPGANARTSQS